MRFKFKQMLWVMLFPLSINAAEFATIYSVHHLNSNEAGQGQAVSVQYGGFGLVGGAEFKNFESDSFLALYGGLSVGILNIELGLNNHSPTLRAGVGIEIFDEAEILEGTSLFVKVGYEEYFDEDDFSGSYIGLELFVFE